MFESVKSIFFFLLFYYLSNSLVAQDLQIKWVKQFPSTDCFETISDIAPDQYGNVYVIGGTESDIDLDPGPSELIFDAIDGEIFIGKFNDVGELLWGHQLPGEYHPDFSIGPSIVLDSLGFIYIAGRFWGDQDFDPGPDTNLLFNADGADLFVCKFNQDGDLIWVQQMEGDFYSNVFDIELDNSGNILLTGRFWDSVDFDPGPNEYLLTSYNRWDMFLAKLDNNGGFLWATELASSDDCEGVALSLDASNNIYLCGSFEDTLFVPGNPSLPDILTTSSFYYNIYLAKFDSLGNIGWVKNINGTSRSEAYDIMVNAAGDIYYIGRFLGFADVDPGPDTLTLEARGYSDAIYSKIDSAGNLIWAKRMGSSINSTLSTTVGNTLSIDHLGNVYSTGYFNTAISIGTNLDTVLLSNGSYDAFLMKMDGDGNLNWIENFGGTSGDDGSAIAVDKWGHVYSSGIFRAQADFAPGPDTLLLNETIGNCDDIYFHKMGQCNVVASISGDLSICSGESTTLTLNGYPTPNWNTGDTTNAIVVSPTQNTNYIASFIDSSGYACQFNTQVIVDPEIEITGPSFICNGQTANITVTGGQDYLWNTGDTTATITTSPITDTTYVVNSITPNGCMSTDTFLLEVLNEMPPQTTISGNLEICAGDSTQLIASGGSTYLWPGWGTSSVIEVSPLTTTAYSVIAYNDLGCSDTASATVIVYESPEAILITGQDSICLGDSTALSVIGEGNFIWNTGDTSSVIQVSPTLTTQYSVTVSDGNSQGCTTSVDQIITVISPTVNISGNTDICLGESTLLVVDGGINYLWSTGATEDNILIAPEATSDYSVTVTDEYGCTASSTLTVTTTIIDTTVTSIDSGLIANSNTSDSYQWLDCNNDFAIITGAINQNFTPIESGSYAVQLSDGTCVDTSGCFYVGVTEVTIDPENELIVFPNPTSRYLVVYFSNSMDAKIEIRDHVGKIISTEQYHSKTTIDLSTYPKGVYILLIKSVTKTWIRRFVKL